MGAAMSDLDAMYPDAWLADDNVESELRTWLDAGTDPLPGPIQIE